MSTIAAKTTLATARERAAGKAVRTMAVPGFERRQYLTMSQTRDDVQYTMTLQPLGWVCSCPGYMYGHVCKHLGALALRAEREGWQFGDVAPRVDPLTGELY